MRKILATLAMIVAMTATACGASPAATAEDFLKAAIACDSAKMSELCPDSDINIPDTDMYKSLLGGMKYKLSETQIAGDTATIEATITQADMQSIITDAQKDLVSVLLDHLGDDSFDSATYGQNLIVEKLRSADRPIKDFTVTIQLDKDDDKWIVVSDTVLFDAICGGVLSMDN